ncbi:ABC transporter ATP-binding protein [Labrys wisconsinensis]|uniref:Spermidine/putrescine transport system ATP-binding protein n=1 Tax=Labrys wisconsinensis TaxID=425677 RepID=A0ABU0JM35_9HYPH|nr:ABC transporter ATP-binding protein [Labrys wisconsinensis]MDQ0475353.1 putative spermidine/putrescine transport system ATP-binding protein [Labrys wisconsinensis]
MTTPFLSIRGIAKRYGTVTAVEDVSLDIAKGEFVTFLGPSGSGKSTTLYVIAGFQDPSAGDVLLEGASLLAVPSNKRNIGMVFQRYTLFPHLSVAGNVAFPLSVRRRPKAEIDGKVAAMLKLVRLDRYADRMPGELSGGQQQRVALARALAYDPPLLLMDEPLSALDKKLREEIQFEIKRIHNETGVTILYVTHDQEEALRLSDRVALFNQGRIEQIGSGRDLYETPATHFVAGFIGNSNFLPGKVTRVAGDRVEAALPDGTLVPDLPARGLGVGDAVSIMVRPDRLTLARAGEASPAATVAATVVDTTFLGDVVHVLTRTAWGEDVSLRLPCGDFAGGLPRASEPVRLGWPALAARLYARG